MRRILIGWIMLCAACIPSIETANTPTASEPAGIPTGNPAPPDGDRYDMGTPALTEIWVDPSNGDDANSGETRAEALASLTEAWNRIPMGSPLTIGSRILLTGGTYPPEAVPVYFESRHASFAAPIVIEAADGPGTVSLPSLNIFDTHYLYLLNLTISADGGDVFHCERCDHLLLRGVTVTGADPETYNVQEAVKINQSQYIYIEDSDISGAWDNAIDFVAVQYGHVVGSRIHNSGDWCQYAKGGSAYLRMRGNEYFDCGTGGFTAGQGTGFEFMVAPWLHYEAYDVKFTGNLLHDIDGACMGVNGGYNILLAYNTCYKVGARSHILEVVFGLRSCDGNVAQCQAYLDAGGWGTIRDGDEAEPIPNRNVFIYNNIFYNPAGFQSAWQHFAIYAPRIPGADSNIPWPSATDTNLQIRGNVIWNGPVDHPLGVEGAGEGCQPQNATCNPEQLRADNAINQFEPQLVDPENGDFRPLEGGNLAGWLTVPIPDFTWEDAPAGVPPSGG